MDKHPTNELMETVISKVHELVNVSAVIGEPIITPDGTTLIPVSKLSFGFASGGSELASKHLKEGDKKPFGGGSGAGVKIDPVAFVVIKEGNVRIMNIEAPAITTLERLVDAAPDLIDKITGMTRKEAPKEEPKAE